MSDLREYHLPHVNGDGWAYFVINTRNGFFSVVSTHGSFAYRWSHPGGEFRAFLTRLYPDYLYGKLTSGRRNDEHDGEATQRAVRKYILELRRHGGTTKELAREEWELTSDLDEDAHCFSVWLGQTSLGDAYEYRCEKPEAGPWSFCTQVYPRFVELLRAELAREAEAPGGAT